MRRWRRRAAVSGTASVSGADRGGSERAAVERVAQRDRHAQRAEAVDALQLLELELLDLAGDVAEVTQVLEIAAILLGLGRLAVHDGDLARLGHALGRALDQRLVDPLLHDLVADVVGAVDVEALLVEAEADRERRVLHEHQVRRLERQRQLGAEPVGTRRDAAHDHELPETEALEVERIEIVTFHERAADVDLMVHAVGLLLLEIVREDRLRRLLLQLQVGGDGLGQARHALLEDLALPIDGAHARIERVAVRGHPAGHGRVEAPQPLQQRLDLGPQERHDADLVTSGEMIVDLLAVLIDPVAKLVERRQAARLVGRHHDVAGQPELRQQVGLDGARPQGGRAADVRQRVERLDPLEHDRIELGGSRITGALQPVEHGLPEPPLDDGMDRGEALLDLRLDPRVELFHAALDGHGEERQHLVQLGQLRSVEVAGAWRAELQRADHPVLVVQRRHHERAHAAGHHLVLDRRAPVEPDEVVHDDGPARLHRALVEGAGELLDLVVHGIGEDARALDARAVVQEQHAVAVERGQPQPQLGATEERAQPLLQRDEAVRRYDGLAVDQVALEGGKDFLIGDLERLQERHAAEHEAFGRQDRRQVGLVEEIRLDVLADALGQWRQRALGLDLHELPVEEQAEVAVQARGLVGDGEDQRVFELDLEFVEPVQYARVSIGSAGAAHARTVEADTAV